MPQVNLTQLAQELIEKSKKATPGKWKHRTDGEFGSGVGLESDEHCVETIYNHGDRSYSRDIAVAAHGYSYQDTGDNWKNMEYIAAANPDAIQSLCQALLEAVSVMKQRRYCEDDCPHQVGDEFGCDCGAEDARHWLAKYKGESE